MTNREYYYHGESPEWDELLRAFDAHYYNYDAAGNQEDTTEYIYLSTPGGRDPTIQQAVDRDGQHVGWTITFDMEEDEEVRAYTVGKIAELIDLIEAN